MIRIGIDQSLSFTGVTVLDDNKNLIKQYGITHKKHTKWDKELDKNPRLGDNIEIWDYQYKEKPKNASTFEIERIKFYNIRELSNVIWGLVHKYTKGDDVTVYMEGISFGSRQTTAIAELSALNYFIRERCYELGCEIVIIPPSKIKKYFTGNGVADKELMMETYFRLEPWAREISQYLKMDDIADSYAMACFDE